MGLLGRKEEGWSLPLCCYLLFWPLPGTMAIPEVYPGYPVALFLENALECKGKRCDAAQFCSTATCALCTSAPEGNRMILPPHCSDPWIMPGWACRAGDSHHPHWDGWAERRLLWLLCSETQRWGCSAAPSKTGMQKAGMLMSVSWHCYYEAKPFPLCIHAPVPHSTSVLLIFTGAGPAWIQVAVKDRSWLFGGLVLTVLLFALSAVSLMTVKHHV